MIKGSDVRTADHAINSLFLDRWSPRAMSAEAIPQESLLELLEAARWAPSAGNSQPWRYLYAHRDTDAFPRFLDLLVDANRVWCVNAAVLLVVVSRSTREGTERPLPTPSFDTGASWACLALQGWLNGLVVHGMAGFDYAKAKQVLGVPDDHRVEAMVAIGRPGAVDALPESHRGRELPSQRRAIEEWASEGAFRTTAPAR